MKILAKLVSKRGHGEIDYLAQISSKEIKFIKRAVQQKVSKKGDPIDTTRVSIYRAIKDVK